MPSPSPKSEMAKALAEATGYSLVYVYRLLSRKSEPVDAEKVRVWRQVVARAARRLTRPDPGRAKAVADVERVLVASCRQPAPKAALRRGRNASSVPAVAGSQQGVSL